MPHTNCTRSEDGRCIVSVKFLVTELDLAKVPKIIAKLQTELPNDFSYLYIDVHLVICIIYNRHHPNDVEKKNTLLTWAVEEAHNNVVHFRSDATKWCKNCVPGN